MEAYKKYFSIQDNYSVGLEMLRETAKFNEEGLEEPERREPVSSARKLVQKPQRKGGLRLVKTPSSLIPSDSSPVMMAQHEGVAVPSTGNSTAQMTQAATMASHRKNYVSKSDDQENIRRLRGEEEKETGTTFRGKQIGASEFPRVFFKQPTTPVLNVAGGSIDNRNQRMVSEAAEAKERGLEWQRDFFCVDNGGKESCKRREWSRKGGSDRRIVLHRVISRFGSQKGQDDSEKKRHSFMDGNTGARKVTSPTNGRPNFRVRTTKSPQNNVGI